MVLLQLLSEVKKKKKLLSVDKDAQFKDVYEQVMHEDGTDITSETSQHVVISSFLFDPHTLYHFFVDRPKVGDTNTGWPRGVAIG